MPEIYHVNKENIICDTKTYEVLLPVRKEKIATICVYCGAEVKEHETYEYDYRDRYTTKHLYCPNQCKGVNAELLEQEEIEKAINNIKSKYLDDKKESFDFSKRYKEVVEAYIQKETEDYNERQKDLIDRVDQQIDRKLIKHYFNKK